MPFDALAILKYIWGFLTFIILGVIKHLYSEFQVMKAKIEALEKEMIELKTSAVTKDKLDDILDKKMKPLQDNIQEVKETMSSMRSDMKGDVSGLRSDVQELIKSLIDKR